MARDAEGRRAMVASLIGETARFVALFAAVIAVIVVFPFLLMVVFRVLFLGNPEKLRTIKKYRELPRR